MRRRRLKRLWKRLREIQQRKLTRDDLLLKLGAAKKEVGQAYRLIDLHLPAKDQAVTPKTFTFALNRNKLRIVRRREGSYLLRSNLTREPPARLWQYYIQLTEIEQMVDIHIPTTDGRYLILPRYTQPDPDQRFLLSQMRLVLPQQSPPKITSNAALVV